MHSGEMGLDASGDLGLRHAADAEAEGDVLGDRLVRPDRVALEDQRHAAPFGRHHHAGAGQHAAVDHDLARGRLDEAGDELQRGTLAAAGGAEQGEHLAGADLEIDAVKRDDRAIGFAEAAHADHLTSHPHLAELARRASVGAKQSITGPGVATSIIRIGSLDRPETDINVRAID